MPDHLEEVTEKPVGARIVGLNLIHTNIVFAPERPKEDDFVFSYEVEIEEPEKVSDNLYAFTADFVVEKRGEESENLVASFSASYLCGMKASNIAEDDIVTVAKSFAATTLWATFSGLAIIATSQMNIDFPNLPPSPSKVDLKASVTAESLEGSLEP